MKYDQENVDCIINIAQIHEKQEQYADSYHYYSKALSINTQSKRAEEGMRKVKKIMDEKEMPYIE